MRSFAAALSAVLFATACASCGIADGASKSSTGPAGPVAARTAASGGDVPETLSAATAAAQANVDHFSSGDFAGVWERMSREVRDGITQDDFVTFYATCKKPGTKIRVAGVSLDPAVGEAIVSMKLDGTERPRIMLFEDGDWVMKPTPAFAAHLGEPVGKIIAEEQSAGLCSD
ncbi:hypothetical protein AB4Z42_05270 [Mycobacterium sp. 2YAF39]|uniref:hypothetical protein n=1 Tax=Mycobacterium sp. 2YAF39 TaxID=3233033 RepID=UPI003F96B628